MGIFDSVGDWFSGAANTVAGGATDLYKNVLTPVGTTIWNGAVSGVNRIANFGENVGNAGLNFATKQGDAINSFSNMLSNPFIMIGALIAAAIILPKLLEK